MRYPDEFNTPTFPAGPRIASSRVFSIATIVVFFLIICTCGLLLWAQRSVRDHPFLVSVNSITGQWDVVGHNHDAIQSVSTTQTLQESVIAKFMRYRFWISDNSVINDALWKSCDRKTDCSPDTKTGIDTGACAIYCISGDTVFTDFLRTVIPDYQARILLGETWRLDMPSVQMLPMGGVNEIGGGWQIRATIISNMSEPIKILAYAQVSRNLDVYPQTLGYYISNFNAYKMN